MTAYYSSLAMVTSAVLYLIAMTAARGRVGERPHQPYPEPRRSPSVPARRLRLGGLRPWPRPADPA